MTRPHTLVLVVGTGTEVGKTWVTCAVARALRAAGVAVSARKPAQSYEAEEGAPVAPTDAELLAEATGEAAHDVCADHRWYPVPMAPPMAADVLGRAPVRLDDLIAELGWPADATVGLVETAGGVRSPLAHDGDGADLVARLAPDQVVLVADAGLGTIHAVRAAAAGVPGYPLTVVLNRFDAGSDLHRRNARWLAEADGFDVVTDPAHLAARLATP